MANVQKYSDYTDIGHLLKHYERSVPAGHYSNENIDCSRLEEDYNLAPERAAGRSPTEYIKRKVEEITAGQKKARDNLVKMVTWIVDKPKNLPENKEQDFFRAAYDFMCKRYASTRMGEDTVLSAYVHKSETTPHLHFSFIPVKEKKDGLHITAKEVINQRDLKNFHRDLEEFMIERGLCKKGDILNGATLRDSSGRVLSMHEFKREERTRTREQKRERNINLDW